jgi:hypothetical protein
MNWLLWRQHRVQFALAVAAIVAFLVPTWITGSHMWSAYVACRASDVCAGPTVLQGDNVMNTIVDLTVVVPLLIGVFWGTTVIGRELETGTATLAWTQSITRRQWLRTKLLTVFGFAAFVSAAMAGLVTWWSRSHNAMQSRFSPLQFDIQGIVPVAYTLFAVAVGLASGVLWRRALPAMATTIGVFVTMRIVIDNFVRAHYMSPVVKTFSMSRLMQGAPPGAWDRGSDLVLNGHVINGPIHTTCVTSASRKAANGCMDALGYRLRLQYQPADRYWTFQYIETAIYVGLATVLVAAAVVLLRRRDA